MRSSFKVVVSLIEENALTSCWDEASIIDYRDETRLVLTGMIRDHDREARSCRSDRLFSSW